MTFGRVAREGFGEALREIALRCKVRVAPVAKPPRQLLRVNFMSESYMEMPRVVIIFGRKQKAHEISLAGFFNLVACYPNRRKAAAPDLISNQNWLTEAQ